MISFSVRVSSDDEASSHSRMWGRFSIARAMATRCFSPPESLSPRSPTTVSTPCGMRLMALSSRASDTASMAASLGASTSPYDTL
mmetsp:Transcript_29055/g.68489  ORF Transcript_29055/g.68489 Transcript_29055/m.68489 type:complete len:85 (+) Transcript_29055:235-489(+)